VTVIEIVLGTAKYSTLCFSHVDRTSCQHSWTGCQRRNVWSTSWRNIQRLCEKDDVCAIPRTHRAGTWHL